jgi:xanthine dehydrogenase YagS FAD-binding subunit
MYPFKYVKPKSIDEASSYLAKQKGKAIPYSGGTDALGLIKDEVYQYDSVVDLKKLDGMDKIQYKKGEGLHIGALATITDIAENKQINDKYTVLSDAAKVIASPQLRNAGTIGGNLCQRPRCWYYRGEFDCIRKDGDICYAVEGENKYHCVIGGGPCFIVHPSDTAVALLALDASVVVNSNGEEKEVPLKDFFVLPEDDFMNENVLKPGEIITEIKVPDLDSSVKSGYYKFMEREVWDFAVVSVAAVVNVKGGKVGKGKLAFGGVAPVPWTEENPNKLLTNMDISKSGIDTVSNSILKNAEPFEQNKFKIQLAKNVTNKLLSQLLL